MTTESLISVVTIIGGVLGLAINWKVSRRRVEAARSEAEVSGAILYRQLLTEYRTPEMQEALEAIKQGNAGLDEYRLVSHFFRAATDFLGAGAIEGELAEKIKTLQGKHLMKHNVIPWEREQRAQIGTSIVESNELNERFLREFNLT